MASMKAWRSGTEASIGGLELVDMPRPEPGAGELLVRVEAAAVNFSDLLMIGGGYQIRPPRPFTPGQEVAGRVVGTGSRVAAKVRWGGFAEYALVRADMAIPIPDAIPAPVAAALPVAYTTALVALAETAAVRPGDWVLIFAATGGLGLAMLQVARHLGARVIAVASGPWKRAVAEEEGAERVVDSSAPDLAARVRSATGGVGARIVVDSVGGAATGTALECLAWRGEILLAGFLSGEIPRIPAHRLLLGGVTARGVYWDHDRDAAMLARCSRRLIALYDRGAIRPRIVDGYRLADLPDALADLRSRRTTGKLVVRLAASET